jgi:sugar phosphate isomerase/epimerase
MAAIGALSAQPTETTEQAQPQQGARPGGPKERELAFYVDPRDSQLAERLEWMAGKGLRHLGVNGISLGDSQNIERARRIIRESGLRLVSAHAVPALAAPNDEQGPLREQHLRDLDRMADWGATSGVYHFRLLHLPWREGIWWEETAYINKVGLEEYDKCMIDLLGWLCDEAAKRGIRVDLENLTIHHLFGYRVEEIVQTVQRLGAPNLGICLDTGHAHGSGLDVAEQVRIAGRHLASTHLNDNFGGGDPRLPLHRVDRHLGAGLGSILWPHTIKALNDVGYNGVAIFEGAGGWGGPWERDIEMTIASWRAFEGLAEQV